MSTAISVAVKKRKPFYTSLWVQVGLAIVLGVALGRFSPDLAVAMKPLGCGSFQCRIGELYRPTDRLDQQTGVDEDQSPPLTQAQ